MAVVRFLPVTPGGLVQRAVSNTSNRELPSVLGLHAVAVHRAEKKKRPLGQRLEGIVVIPASFTG